jgi:organic radical activating enzyme
VNKLKLFFNRKNDFLRLYWKLHFISPKQKKYFWTRGIAVVAVLTTRCNLHCPNCPMFLHSQTLPPSKESTLEQWKEFFTNFPTHIEEVFFSGGETTLYPYVSELANFLTERGTHVCIFTNLWNWKVLLKLKKSFRLVIYPTFHHSDKRERFDKAYQELSKYYRVIPIELGECELPYTKSKETFDRQYFIDEYRFHFAPDTPQTKKMFVACDPLYEDARK